MRRILFISTLALMSVTTKVTMAQQQSPGPQPAPETGEKFKIGMAGFTFWKFDIDTTLKTMQRVDVHYLCIKDFQLPLESTGEQIAAFKTKLKAGGVTGYAVGPIMPVNIICSGANAMLIHIPSNLVH